MLFANEQLLQDVAACVYQWGSGVHFACLSATVIFYVHAKVVVLLLMFVVTTLVDQSLSNIDIYIIFHIRL